MARVNVTPGTPDADRRARLMRKGGKPTEEERTKTGWDGKHGKQFSIRAGLGEEKLGGWRHVSLEDLRIGPLEFRCFSVMIDNV